MPTPAAFDTVFASHTFGRHHVSPPLYQSIQQGQTLPAGQMGGDTYHSQQPYDQSLSQDLDHLVRSVGEW